MTVNPIRFSLIATSALFLAVTIVQERALADDAMTVDEIRLCMCQEHELQDLRQQTATQQTRYNDARAQVQNLEAQIDKTRKTMDPSDDISVQILSEMIRQRDALNNQIRVTVYPETQAAVTKLNASVANYNQNCTQRSMLKTDVDNASRNLICPSAQAQ